MNDLMMSVGVLFASATWEWFRRRPAGGRGAPAQTWQAVDTGVRRLRVTRVERETAEAMTLHLLPESGAPLRFTAGQFLPLRVRVGTEQLWRAYSLSTSPLEGPGLAVTIKRVPGGRVSNHLHEHVRPGDVLEACEPTGTFTVPPSASGPRHLVFVAGGSGITPIRSLLRTLRVQEPESRFTLLYGNRRREDILFHGELEALAVQSGGRLRVRHVLARPPPGWSGGVGMLDTATCAAELEALGAFDSGQTRYLLCGPQPMMDAARTVLRARGVPAGSIAEERFTAAPVERAAWGSHEVTFRTRAGVSTVRVAGQTLLQAAREAKVPLASLCERGVCGTCKVRVCSGAVEAGAALALSEQERAGGYVLACVAHPASATAVDLEPERGGPRDAVG